MSNAPVIWENHTPAPKRQPQHWSADAYGFRIRIVEVLVDECIKTQALLWLWSVEQNQFIGNWVAVASGGSRSMEDAQAHSLAVAGLLKGAL
jgi:hypothetical protein